jgi:aspartate/methionine/tyrosine aminotransferase
MRRRFLYPGATELHYEIREIVKVAKRFERMGIRIRWENIGDPVQKGVDPPPWMKKIVSDLALQAASYAYSPTKGVLETRRFLAQRTNAKGGVRITEEDILFCNGLGDAISKVYEYLDPGARVIGPSPAYSTHSSAEGSHASQPPLTYRLDPENNWHPDLEDLANKVKYNPNVVGILLIHPNNPTGTVYSRECLDRMVRLAKEYRLFLVADEIYTHITYNGAKALELCEVIGPVCGIAMKGISKEFPWPGSRCGWLEFYNTDQDPEFAAFVKAIEDAKMLEVCSTTLPQMAIPAIMTHPEYWTFRGRLNQDIQRRGELVFNTLKEIPEILINRTSGAFYQSVVFKPGVLNGRQALKVSHPGARELVEQLTAADIPLDRRFAYYLLAAHGICAVPLSGFCTDLLGFRVTLLECDSQSLEWTYARLKEAIQEYVRSA